MKHLITLFILFISTISFGQGTGLIVGKILDNVMNEEPLIFANVFIKGTDLKSTSDVTGLFLLENLKDGIHTLVFSYPGYETKELDVQIISGAPTEINLVLKVKTLSLNALTSSREISKNKTITSSF
jgi:hypothetical protein